MAWQFEGNLHSDKEHSLHILQGPSTEANYFVIVFKKNFFFNFGYCFCYSYIATKMN